MGSKGPKEAERESSWLGLLQKAGEALVPVLVTAGSLVGFVAFAGSVIVWTRFFAVDVPPDQAVAAFPRGELVAIGSSLLLLFGFFGALAALAVYLIDRGGRTTPGMSRGLLLLLAIEGVAAVLLLEGSDWQKKAISIELLVLPIAVVWWATHVGRFTQLDRRLPDREGDEPEAVLESGPFRTKDGKTPIERREIFRGLRVALSGTLLGAAVAGSIWQSWVEAAMAGLALLSLTLVAFAARRWIAFYREAEKREGERRARRREKRRRRRRRKASGLPRAQPQARGVPRPAREPTWRRIRGELRRKGEGERPDKPPRLVLTEWGGVLMGAMMALAALGPSIVLWKGWLAASLASAIVLAAGLWRIAGLVEARFMWYGLAVFISVPLFGTLTAMARNIEDPQIQPMALIRSADGPDEAIQGLYVTEGDDRVYFASVATEGCTDDVTPHSGRLLWVPKEEVTAMAVGPLQGIGDAAATSLEMAYALTPAVETPAGERVSLTAAEEEAARVAAASGEGGERENRLERAGPAVRPNFGSGLSLDPENAPPGEKVTLSTSDPKTVYEDGRERTGFGPSREGRTLRVGGVRAEIVRRNGREVWGEERIEFVVPENASTGIVTVECESLAGQPLLRVERPPEARIAVRMRPGSGRVVLDGRLSRDDGEVASRRWTLNGLPRGGGKPKVSLKLPPRLRPYRVRLTVVDGDEETDSAEVRLLRLPAAFFAFDGEAPERPGVVRRVRRALVEAARRGAPVRVEVNGHADDPGRPRYNVELSEARAENVRRALLNERTAAQAGIEGAVPVVRRALGESCPLDAREGRRPRNRRVDVIAVGEGVRIVHPRSCRPRRVERLAWSAADSGR